MTQLLIPLGLCGWYAWWISLKARVWAEGSPGRRRLGLWAVVPLMALGVVVALWLPEHIDFNRESPAGIFYIYLPCWTAGAALFFGGIGVGVGAGMARGGDDE